MAAWKTENGFNQIRTVLIISQDCEMVKVWENLLRQKNCHVVHEATTQHALQTARLLSPPLIIFNLELRQPEQIALCRELRATTGAAILLLASAGRDPAVFEYYQAGVDEHILTPVNPLALLIRSLTWWVKQEHTLLRVQPISRKGQNKRTDASVLFYNYGEVGEIRPAINPSRVSCARR